MMSTAARGLPRKTAVAALLAILMVLSAASTAQAITVPISGTAIGIGGNRVSNSVIAYESPGLLGSGTITSEFTLFLDPATQIVNATGTFVLTRSDGATLSGPTTATVGPISGPTPWPLDIDLIVTAGTGDLAGAEGEINLTGRTFGPGASADPPAAMTGTLTIPRPVPASKDQCKDGGWRELDDDQGQAFANQGRCVSFVQAGA